MTSINDKISHVLEETRVILPGTQALLGFQLVAVFSSSFEKLSPALKDLHLVSLGFLVLSSIFLMTTAAYHRIAEDGEDTKRFHRVASRSLIAAMVALALGLATDIFVVVRFVDGSAAIAWIASVATFLFACLMWYVFPFAQRKS